MILTALGLGLTLTSVQAQTVYDAAQIVDSDLN